MKDCLHDCAYITDFESSSSTFGLYISEDGVPVLTSDSQIEDSFRLPSYWEIDELCSARTLREEGQAFLITDLLVRNGYCTYRNASEMREKIRQNLKNRNFYILTKQK